MKTVVVLLCLCLCPPALALTIATGTPEGTYYQIGRDIEQLAGNEGIPVELVRTNGSLENMNLVGAGKVDLAILQIDALKFAAETLQARTGMDVLKEVKIVLNLYFEEIHIIANNESIRSLEQLNEKRVAVGPENSGSALTSDVLLTLYGVRAQKVFDGPAEAVKKLQNGQLDALMFVGGAPVPAFEKLDRSFHFVTLPSNALMEQIYQKRKIAPAVYLWAGETETYTVPSVIVTRDRKDEGYAAVIQKLLLAIFSNKDKLNATGHPKWKSSLIRYVPTDNGYPPAVEMIQFQNRLDLLGYRIIKK